ncbi:hypothetical protein RvY_13887 [Ramazzottius varieornatus]|uniref:Vta1/callose synthase N-terminal domain-containing protein n=1 Tax=Ramazzottius varieornatus TaxID=947166 RepID=A0A1D1VUL8_RAMVA|nr:hypothetical protein RvY_13887 [Ramazzottius varieornatus]
MASIKNLPPCPDNLKPMLHYLKAAAEHDQRDAVVAYWLRFYAVQLGIRIDSKSQPAKVFISGVMDNLETTKKSLKTNEAVTSDMVAQAHIENYALKLFLWADSEDRASHFNKNVVRAFYTSGLLFDVLSVWGEPTEDILRQQKYAKWKAAYLHNCLKNGETPVPGPAGGEEASHEAGHVTTVTNEEEAELRQLGQFGRDDNMSSSTTFNHGGGGGQAWSNSQAPSAYDKLFLPPDHASPAAKPPHTLPTAAPRGTAGMSSHTPSPSTENRVPSSGAVQIMLSADDMSKAQKYCKYAASALQFDDVATATDLLEKTLRLIKTGRED